MSAIGFVPMGGRKKSMASEKEMGGIGVMNDHTETVFGGTTVTYIQDISPYDAMQCDASKYRPEWACAALKSPDGYYAYLFLVPDNPVNISFGNYTYTVTLKVISGYWKFEILTTNRMQAPADLHTGLFSTLCAWKSL